MSRNAWSQSVNVEMLGQIVNILNLARHPDNNTRRNAQLVIVCLICVVVAMYELYTNSFKWGNRI
jgi:hypothetical protein